MRVLQFFIISLSFSSIAQVVSHQTIAAQGTVVKIPTIVVVKQSVGQQSVIGKYSVGQSQVGQGFLQRDLSKKNSPSEQNEIQVSTYPNPFNSVIHFQFLVKIDGPVLLELYDMLGQLLYSEQVLVENNLLSLEPGALPFGTYKVTLKSQNLNYTTSIIKTK
jgi:hypothetical protein